MKTETTQLTSGKANELLSLRQAAQILHVNRMWLSGYLFSLGLLQPLGTSLGIRRRDLTKVKLPKRRKET